MTPQSTSSRIEFPSATRASFSGRSRSPSTGIRKPFNKSPTIVSTQTVLKESLPPPLPPMSVKKNNKTGYTVHNKNSNGVKSLSDRSDSSCSIPSSSNPCDSGSEVSDEGYKSSQGLIGVLFSKPNLLLNHQEQTEINDLNATNRPESSLTEVSDCSSTISSDDDDEDESSGADTWKVTKPESRKMSREPSITRSMSERSTSYTDVASTPTATPKMNRSKSITSEAGSNNFSRSLEQRHSYRIPRNATSRYKQAAEAYKHKNLSKSNSGSFGGSWTSTTPRSRSALSTDTYRRPVSRTASASPGPFRRESSFNGSGRRKQPATPPPKPPKPVLPSSTQSTPSRRKPVSRSSLDDDDLILQRMEEILMSYKSQVEDRLAAEGRELPKEIFEDFTSHWVNATNHKSTPKPRIAPTPRKEFRDGRKETKIPIPTFYNSPIPSETNI